MTPLELGMCLAAGIVFAGLAVWLTTQRGNTIRDILDSPNANAQQAAVDVAGKFKIATNIPIVALYVVAAFVAVGLPMLVQTRSTERYQAWRVKGKLSKDSARNVFASVHPPTLPVDKDGHFDDWIPVAIDGDGRPLFPSITFHGERNSSGNDVLVLHPGETSPSHAQTQEGRFIQFAGDLTFDTDWQLGTPNQAPSTATASNDASR